MDLHAVQLVLGSLEVLVLPSVIAFGRGYIRRNEQRDESDDALTGTALGEEVEFNLIYADDLIEFACALGALAWVVEVLVLGTDQLDAETKVFLVHEAVLLDRHCHHDVAVVFLDRGVVQLIG